MDTKRSYYHSLRFKIIVALALAVVVVLVVTSWLRYNAFRRALTESVGQPASETEEITQAQLSAYVRSRAILTISSVVVILVVGDLMINSMVIRRLRRFLSIIRTVSQGNLGARVAVEGQDELAELARAFNRMTEDLQRQTEKLSTLNTLAATVSQSLDLSRVLQSALHKVMELTRVRAGWVTLRDVRGDEFHLAASQDLPEDAALAHAGCDWNRCVCAGVFASGQSQVFHHWDQQPCRAAEHLQKEGLVFRACIPLKSKDRVLGVMSLVGAAANSTWMFAADAAEMLTAVGRQVGVAVENASLYEELRQTEAVRRQLIVRGIDLQEEERTRIARELHDQTSQRLTSILMTLRALGETESLAEVRAAVPELRRAVAQTVEEVHDLALELRPRLLDDLGLQAALRHYLGEFRDRFHIPVDLQVVGLEEARLSSQAETALYRIAQEALTNVARHAQAQGVGVLLEQRGNSVVLVVEDDGRGFDVTRVMDSGLHESNLGLYGMRERAALLGGTLTVESTPGMGTSVFAEIPLERREDDRGQDPPAGG